MSASAADVMATVAAESRRDNKDCRCILNRDAWPKSHDCRMVPEPIEVAQIQLTDVRDPFDRHDHAFEAEAPGERGRLQTERRRHLGPEDAAAAELHPPPGRDLSFGLHARLRVEKEPRSELYAGLAEPSIERFDRADQLREIRAVFHHDAFNLMKFRQMFPVDRIGTEVAADDERLPRWIGMLREPLQGDRRRVGPEDGPPRLLAVPSVPPSRAPGPPAVLVRLRDAIHNPLLGKWDRRGLREIERVELVPRRVVLRLEQGVEVPEGRLDEVPVNLREAHAQENPTNLFEVRAEHVPFPRPYERGEGLRVVPPEVHVPPFSGAQQTRRRLSDLLLEFEAAREDLLSRRRQGDLPSDRFALFHQLSSGLQVAQQPGIDRVLRQLFLAEPRKELFVRPFRVRRFFPDWREKHDAPSGAL